MRSDTEYLRLTVEIATESRASGNHPFGALLVGPEGDVLLSSGNTYARDRGVGHAESNVARAAAQQYDPAFLERCMLVTSVEPCCMCAGALLLGWHRHRGLRTQRKSAGRDDRRQPEESDPQSELSPSVRRRTAQCSGPWPIP